MNRHEWEDLPHGVRDAIEFCSGPVASVSSPPAGRNSDLALTVHARAGQVLFCKGAQLGNTAKARLHRHEARIAPHLPLAAPGLIWSIEESGWLVNAFEHIDGKHADLSPNSPDLPRVAHAIDGYTTEGEAVLRDAPTDLAPPLAQQWERQAAWRRLAHDTPDDLDPWERHHLDNLVAWENMAFPLVDGDALCHTELHERHILIGDTVRVIDWAHSRRAAPFIDVVVLVIRLIAAGHEPDEAENWAADLPAWRNTTPGAITASAVALLGIWEHQLHNTPGSQPPSLVAAARNWVQHRISTH